MSGNKFVTVEKSARADYCDKSRIIQKSVDLSARKSEMASFTGDLMPFRKSGKKIDPAHIAGNTAVANHIAS